MSPDPALLRDLLDTAPVMLWTSGPDGRGTWVNRRWEEFTGSRYGEMTWADCLEPSDLARLRPVFEDALKVQRGYRMEYRMRRHDGVYRWVMATATPRFGEDGEFLGYLGSSVDITDRREGERQLREGSLAIRTLYEVIAQVDRPFDEQIEALLLVGCQVFQLEAGLLIEADGSLRHHACFESEALVHARQVLSELAVTETFGSAASPVGINRVGRGSRFGIGLWTAGELWGALVFTSPRPRHAFGDFDREFVRLMATWISSAMLREQARARQRQLDEAIRAAQRLESLGMLAGGIAHDFNNLLTGVLNNAEVALEDARDPALRECIDDIRVAAIRAAELTNQLLAYAGRRKVRARAVDLDAIIRESQPILAPALDKGAMLEMDLGGVPILGEHTPLRQIVVNLVLNASEANATRVRVRTRATESLPEELSDLPQGKYVLLTVSDDGSGMDEATRARIFEPFFTTKFKGRGLGLAAVMGLVHQLGGDLVVESSHGVGTVFTVALPVATGDPVQELPTEDQVLRTLQRILTRIGFSVLAANSGRKGLEALARAEERPRLIVLDIVMPEMDGAETLRRIRAIDEDIPVLLTSGFAMKEVVDRFDMEHVAGFVPKPFQQRRLLSELKKILD